MIRFVFIVSALSLSVAKAQVPVKNIEDCDPLKKPKIVDESKAPTGIPMMWVDRGPIEKLDLFWGGSAPDRAPYESLFFDKNKAKGTSPGVKLKDAYCVKWSGKFNGLRGKEVHAEIAASRLAWAMGFLVEETYYRDQGQIIFSTKGRNYDSLSSEVKSFIQNNGNYTRPIRLEKEEPGQAEYTQTWFYNNNLIKNNPATAKYFSALAIFNVLVGNWDLGKTIEKSNNKILGRINDKGQLENWYIISDLGGSFGEIGARQILNRNHSKYDFKDFDFKSNGGKNDPPVSYVEGQTVHMNIEAEIIEGHLESLKKIPLAHAQWFANHIAPLKLDQIQQAFKAAGSTEEEIVEFSRILKARIDQFVGCVTKPDTCRNYAE
ncbi:MAG: hypothetical protein AB7F59_13855 [Bdellovibrionales bacterium]